MGKIESYDFIHFVGDHLLKRELVKELCLGCDLNHEEKQRSTVWIITFYIFEKDVFDSGLKFWAFRQ